MKKTILVSVVAAAAFAATAAFSANSVSAADTDTSKGTTGTIGLTDAKDTDGNNATVTLDSAPDISFGTQSVSTTAQTYYASAMKTPVQVTNPGINSGWTAQVSATAFNGDNGTSLKGAELNLVSTDATAADGSNESTAPTTASVTKLGAANQTIMSAKDGSEGVGVWQDALSSDSTDPTKGTNLYVPAGNVAGSYKAELTWTMVDSAK